MTSYILYLLSRFPMGLQLRVRLLEVLGNIWKSSEISQWTGFANSWNIPFSYVGKKYWEGEKLWRSCADFFMQFRVVNDPSEMGSAWLARSQWAAWYVQLALFRNSNWRPWQSASLNFCWLVYPVVALFANLVFGRRNFVVIWLS